MSLTDTLIALARGTWTRFTGGGRTPVALMAAVDAAIAVSETVSRETMARNIPDLQRVACTKGCAWCCHYQVGITAPQALHIAHNVTNGKASLPAATLIERLRVMDEKTRGLVASARLKLKLPCAFLENGACTIYAFRPFGCRGANSIDAELCRAFVEGRADAAKSGGAWLHKVPYEAQRDVQDGFHAGSLEQGLRDDRLELTAGVLVALETAGAAERWLAGEDIFRAARLPQ
jgi:uncharacterized protein